MFLFFLFGYCFCCYIFNGSLVAHNTVWQNNISTMLTLKPFLSYENKIPQLWHKRWCLNYGNINSRSNKIGEFLFRALLFFVVLFLGFVRVEYGNVFFYAYQQDKKRRVKMMMVDNRREKKNVNRMARKCSLTMTPSQNVMCIVGFFPSYLGKPIYTFIWYLLSIVLEVKL